MTCYICQNEIPQSAKHSYQCPVCFSLINLGAKDIDYKKGGGQDVPDQEKTRKRLKNSQLRLAIIEKTLDKSENYAFIDIGSGSGEMLQAAGNKEYISESIGFEPNKILHAYSSKKYRVYNSDFDPEKLINYKCTPKIIALSHVLEHISQPYDLLQRVLNFMNKKDILYIEVPSYEGRFFTYLSFKWKLWYDEHKFLFSVQTMQYLQKKLSFRLVGSGRRVFYKEHSFRILLMALLKEPHQLLAHGIRSRSLQQFLDNFFGDYLYFLVKMT